MLRLAPHEAKPYKGAMRIVLLDDGVAFDGESPDARPLGGAEKAFARLAGALAARGHEVTAINRCETQTIVGTVPWLPWDAPRPPQTDVVIAFRKATLLGEIPEARHRCLWLWDPADTLGGEAERNALAQWRPTVVFTGETHRRGLKSEALKTAIIAPGVSEPYRLAPESPSPPLVAVITTHPLHGLQPIVRLWRDQIHPARPSAELQIYSVALRKALDTDQMSEQLRPVFDDVRAGRVDGITVHRPLPDSGMAEVYARARAHLYPVIQREMYASTLAESQAAGLPAIVRATGGATRQLLERVKNGATGYFAPDDDAFVNLALALLDGDDRVYANLAREARVQQRGRGWREAAAEFETLWQ
jgi:glycosyltransferase involved in cell wall biosynthesis